MAVTAADAVAAAYLADAAAAGPSAMARQAAAAAAAASMQAEVPSGEQQGQASSGGLQPQGQQRQEGIQQQGAVPALRSTDGSGGSSGAGSDAGSAARPLEAGWWPTFVHRQLGSTRQLQRFTNGVALQRWLYRQYRGVVDIYEDRLQLWAISGGGRRLEVGGVGGGVMGRPV